jgi:hypothetical protein
MLGSKTVTPESVSVCILFDRHDGRVVHTHRVVTLPGGKKLSTEQVEKRALELARKLHLDVSKLGVLHVPPEQYKASANLKVDIHSHQLIGLPTPKPLREHFARGK